MNNRRTSDRWRIASLRPGWLMAPLLGMIPGVPLAEDAPPAQDKVQLVVTGSSRAIVLFNNERLVLKTGERNHPRVVLQSADSERAIILVDDVPLTLETGSVAAPVLADDRYAEDPLDDDGPDTVTLWAEPNGFFFANGSINRRSARFLVDTGANTVTLSGVQADRLGVDYRDGKNGYAHTASGVTPIKSIVIKRMTVEGITLRNIAANVIPGRFPEYPLLGGSFLGKLNMVRSGNKMELSRR